MASRRSSTSSTEHNQKLKEGQLLKRQRGKHKGQKLGSLKFQNRFIRLDTVFLSYYVSSRDKAMRGKFPVSFIEFVEEVPPNTFTEISYGFQIGNQDEVMYFGAKSARERSEWMEAIRLAAFQLAKNTVLAYYHSGVYGKDIPNQWSCCKKVKKSEGCKRSSQYQEGTTGRSSTDLTQSVPSYARAEVNMADNVDDEMCSSLPAAGHWNVGTHAGQWIKETPASDSTKYQSVDTGDEGQRSEETSVLPSQTQQTLVKVSEEGERHSSLDSQSILSGDSGFQDKYGSKYSLSSEGTPLSHRRVPAVISSPGSIMESAHEDAVYDQAHVEEILKNNGYSLHLSTRYESALNALDFRGADTLIIAGENGKVHVWDILFSEDQAKIYDHSEVVSVVSWRSLLLICTKNGVYLRDIDSSDFKYKMDAQSEQLAVFSPDGSKVIVADTTSTSVEVLTLNLKSEKHPTSPLHSIILPGKPSFLSVSPDSKHSIIAVGIGESDQVFLYDYCNHNNHLDSVNIGEVIQPGTGQATFSPNLKGRLAVIHRHSLTVVQIKQTHVAKVYSETVDKEAMITCLQFSPTGDDLVIGMSSGNIVVLHGKSNEFNVQHRLNFFNSQGSPLVKSLSFSKDCSLLAFGYSDGRLNIVNCSALFENNELPYCLRTITVKSSGGVLELYAHSIRILFPNGFIAQPSVTFKYAVLSHEFISRDSFPSEVRPVSAILILEPTEKVEFLIPIEVTLPHFIDLEDEEVCASLKFFSAPSDVNTSQQKLDFREVLNAEMSLFTSRKKVEYATFFTHHCCYLCVGEYFKEHTNKAKLSLTQARSKDFTNDVLQIDYCLHYSLPTCVKMIEKQYPKELYALESCGVKFVDTSSDSQDDQSSVGIEIQNAGQLQTNGWQWFFANESTDTKLQICRKDLCFWDIPTTCELVSMCEQKLYPPRFSLRVSPASPSSCSDAQLRVSFPGVVFEFKQGTPLLTVLLRNKTSHSSANSGQSTEVLDASEADVFRKLFGYIARTVPRSFDFISELYSAKFLQDEQFESYIKKLDRLRDKWSEQNAEVLFAVKKVISEKPYMFNEFCEVLSRLHYQECADHLRSELMKALPPSPDTISGSEKSSVQQDASTLMFENEEESFTSFANQSPTPSEAQGLPPATKSFFATY